jgi:hypothetical protein
VLDAIATALRLTDAERQHLTALAEQRVAEPDEKPLWCER